MGEIAELRLSGKWCGNQNCGELVNGQGQIAFCSEECRLADNGEAEAHKEFMQSIGRYLHLAPTRSEESTEEKTK